LPKVELSQVINFAYLFRECAVVSIIISQANKSDSLAKKPQKKKKRRKKRANFGRHPTTN
jgi:hypothetical protein